MNRSLQKFVYVTAALSSLTFGATAAQATPFTLDISLGVRETGTNVPIGSDGGTSGGIEWVNKDGQSFVADGTWQQFVFTPSIDPLSAFAGLDANAILNTSYGVLEHIRIRSTGDSGPWSIYIDDVVNTTANGPTSLTGFEGYALGTEVMFQEPGFSGSTVANLLPGTLAGVSGEEAHSGDQSYKIDFEFVDTDPSRWVRLSTFGTAIMPNPTVLLSDPLTAPPTISFWLMANPATEVPEPAPIALLALGLAGLALRRRNVAVFA